MQDRDALIERLSALFVERFNVEVPAPDTDLLDTGILDSLQLVELLLQLEQEFDFRIAIETLELDDLRTLARLAGVLTTASGAIASATPPPRHAEGEAAGRAASAHAGAPSQSRENSRLTLIRLAPESAAAKPPRSAQGRG
jgi:methoxymalonate biosynthesis acyl carrier protein